MKKQQATFRIPDIHCEGCTTRLTNVLERVEGVQSAHVSLEGKRAEVEYDANATREEDLRGAVERAGYTVEADD